MLKSSSIKEIYDRLPIMVKISLRYIFIIVPWKYRGKRFMITRIPEVLMMMVMFHLKPEKVCKYSTHKRLLPDGSKYKINERPSLLPFTAIPEKSDDLSDLDEISIVMGGASFNLEQLREVKQPIFFVGYNNKDKINFRKDWHVDWNYIAKLDKIIKNNELDITYVHSIIKYHRIHLESGIKFLFLYGHHRLGDNIFKAIHNDPDTVWYLNSNNPNFKKIAVYCTVYPQPNKIVDSPNSSYKKGVKFTYLPVGSGLVTISALYPFAKKINVYGWDFHLKSSPELMNYMEVFSNTYNYTMDKRSRDHFESTLINYYYGYHISKLPKIHVHGYLGKLEKHREMINRIERILFDC